MTRGSFRMVWTTTLTSGMLGNVVVVVVVVGSE